MKVVGSIIIIVVEFLPGRRRENEMRSGDVGANNERGD